MNFTLENSITKENIRKMVDTFYPTILADELVSPFFIAKLGDDINSDIWQEHLQLLANFWAGVALNDTSYQGSPFPPHLHLGELTREIFERWLSLFSEAIDRVYTKEAGEFFKVRSSIIGDNFMRNLGI
ncbi:Truncated hemoglobins [hydrothermal vent metagenome]|uniref:Truncated hemoglobins n=1 Tax=hydrothermal vent metagenome TaxID=652676 RepID=A0A1W1BPJ8_9ZZZZ